MVLGFFAIVFFQSSGRRRAAFFAFTALSVILSRGLLTEIIRFVYSHPRPFDALNFAPLIPESGNSFPSGHASFFFALAMSIWFFSKEWGITYFILAALNGLARIYSGVHWPLDIIGGVIVGMGSAAFLYGLLRPSISKLTPAPPKEAPPIA
jgi:undecaprenyl-diphosphatase